MSHARSAMRQMVMARYAARPQMPISEKIAALHRTLDWMEANPDKTVCRALATTAEGKRCRPSDPDATCFCFIGRLCVEAGDEARLTTNFALDYWFADFKIAPLTFSIINDDYKEPEKRVAKLRQLVNAIVEEAA